MWQFWKLSVTYSSCRVGCDVFHFSLALKSAPKLVAVNMQMEVERGPKNVDIPKGKS